jgi:hypothetical protein
MKKYVFVVTGHKGFKKTIDLEHDVQVPNPTKQQFDAIARLIAMGVNEATGALVSFHEEGDEINKTTVG